MASLRRPGGRSALLRTLRDPELFRFELGYLGHAFALNATWLALLVYAMQRGGAREVGLVAVVMLLPGVVLAPFAAYAGDRYTPQHALALGYAVQAISNAAVAVAMWHGNANWVYGAAVVSSTAVTFSRPVMLSVLPNATRTPAALVAANMLTGTIEQVGLLFGPLVAGVLMALASPGAVFLASAIATGASTLLVVTCRTQRHRLPTLDIDAADVLRQVFAGFAALRRVPHVAVLIFLMASSAVTVGIADVLFVTFAELQWGRGGGASGALNAAWGLGAIVAAITCSRVLRCRNVAMPILLIGMAITGGLAMLSVIHQPALALLAFAFTGAAAALMHLTASVAVQRRAPSDVMSRVFGIAEGIHLAGLAVGSAAFAFLLTRTDLHHALLSVACGVLAPVTLGVGVLHFLGEHSEAADEAIVERIAADTVLAPLPAPVIERLASHTVEVLVATGNVIVRQGDRGDRYYLVMDGAVEVWCNGTLMRTMTAGSSFGEVALLRDTPRTATVTAIRPTRLLALDRDDFLAAVKGHPRSLGEATAIVERYVAA